MNGSSFIYTVMATLFGMAVVFGFLIVLSALMVVIKRVLGDRQQKSAPPSKVEAVRTTPRRSEPRRTDADRSTDGPPPWLFAAVTAFLLEEEEIRSAQPWIEGRVR